MDQEVLEREQDVTMRNRDDRPGAADSARITIAVVNPTVLPPLQVRTPIRD